MLHWRLATLAHWLMQDDVNGSPRAKNKPASGCSAKMWILEIAAAIQTADDLYFPHISGHGHTSCSPNIHTKKYQEPLVGSPATKHPGFVSSLKGRKERAIKISRNHG